MSLNDEIEYTFGPRYEHPEIARLRSRISALEGLLREVKTMTGCSCGYDTDTCEACIGTLSRLDAALTPDRKAQS